jgi:thiol reductant ABC exporter CydC subunit
MRTILRLLVLLRPFIGWVALSILLGSATIAAGIGLLGTSAYLIARASQQPSIAVLQVAIVGVRFFGISRAVFRYLERLVSHSVNFRLLTELRVVFYRSLEPLAPARLQHLHSGDLLSRAVADIETLENFYVRSVAPPVVAFVITLGVSLFVGLYHPLLAWILASGLLVGGMLVPLLIRLLALNSGRAMIEQRSNLRRAAVEGIQGMPDLVSNNGAAGHIAAINALSKELSRSQQRLAWTGGLSSGLMILVSGLTLWLVLWAAIPMLNIGVFDGIALAVLVLVTIASFEAVNPLGQAAQQLESSLNAARRLFALVDAEPEITAPPDPCPLPEKIDICMRGLSFRYLPALPYALEKIDLDLPAGKRLAVVGPSGAGKSTLAHSLLRLWDYSCGEISLSGCDLRRFDPQDIRRKISVVSQRSYLFSGTLRQNLLLAHPDASDAQLEHALNQAGLLEWVAQLPAGWETWIGERGMQVSGGERQRIALARCFLQNAPVLLLDEPAANLDAQSEQRLLESIFPLMHGRSVLWITHRLTGMEMVDEVVVLNAGRIVQRGTHQSLIQLPGLYQRLWNIQKRILLDLPGTSGPSPAF